jgi:hypothetical protein
MKVLLLSCLIYLIGITAVLYFRPKLMFQDNGNWKEFGLSNDAKHTWFPFWLYCISSAFVSYALSYFIYSLLDSKVSEVDVDTVDTVETVSNVKTKTKNSRKNSNPSEMKSGYYVLDKEAYENKGIPKYIFLGSEVPDNN